MAQKNQIGVYVGTEFLNFVEAQKGQILYSENVPHFQMPSSKEEASEGVKLTASIQKILRDRKITNPRVDLSLPAKDVIFRAFVMPNMTAPEMQDAVSFEARKYIPFKIEDLFYTFRAVPFTENQVKKNRILFLGIRKETLTKYSQVFEQANGKVISAEPASINLLRLLIWKKRIQPDEKIAIIQLNDGEGAITIIEKQLPQFIRDFLLFSTNEKERMENPEEIIKRIRNEVHISRDFYKRQFSSISADHEIKQIFIFSDKQGEEIAKAIEDETEVKTSVFNIDQSIDGMSSTAVSPLVLNALGASLSSIIRLTAELDLVKSQVVNTAAGIALDDFGNRSPNFSLTAKIAGACALIIGILFWVSYSQNLPLLNKKNKLKITEKKYQHFSAQTLRKKTIEMTLKNKEYHVIRFRSDVTSLLSLLPKLLPKGVWLSNVKIDYEDSLKKGQTPKKEDTLETKVLLDLNGYSYAEDLSKQINLIENLVENLKNNDSLKQKIESFKLNTVNKAELEGFPVTSFKITITLLKENNDRS
ncbi:MAG: pilus assembly protein PilM [Candidatus Aceula meridiana]|nr:pilus assembly protein PilM [Candidatus Aceula meridiana]